MTQDTQWKLKKIFEQASHDAKGNFSIYHMYRHMIEDLILSPKEFETAIKKLTNILKV